MLVFTPSKHFVHLLNVRGQALRDLTRFPYHISICYMQDLWDDWSNKRHELYRLERLYSNEFEVHFQDPKVHFLVPKAHFQDPKVHFQDPKVRRRPAEGGTSGREKCFPYHLYLQSPHPRKQ